MFENLNYKLFSTPLDSPCYSMGHSKISKAFTENDEYTCLKNVILPILRSQNHFSSTKYIVQKSIWGLKIDGITIFGDTLYLSFYEHMHTSLLGKIYCR